MNIDKELSSYFSEKTKVPDHIRMNLQQALAAHQTENLHWFIPVVSATLFMSIFGTFLIFVLLYFLFSFSFVFVLLPVYYLFVTITSYSALLLLHFKKEERLWLV